MPDNLPDWITTANACELPVLSSSRHKLITLLDNEQNIKVNDLLEIARLDPGFSMTLLRHAGTKQKKEITTLSHAILLISIPQTVKILSQLPVLEKKLTPQIVSSMKQLYSRQYLTAFLAREWSILRKESENNELFTAGLNRGFFHFILYLIDPKKAVDFEKSLLSNNPGKLNQEKKILGRTANELSEAIAKRWRLPELILESYSGKHHNPKITGIRMATELVEWIYSNSSIQYPDELVSRIAEYIRIPVHQTPGMINKTIIKVFHQAYNKLPNQPLLRIFMSNDASIYSPSMTDNKDDKKILSRYIKLLRSTTSTRDLIKIAVEAIHKGVGFSRVLFMSYDKNENSLKGHTQAIENSLPDLIPVSVSLDLNKLYKQLLKKEQILIINKKNQHKYCIFLPEIVRPLTPNATIIMSSIYINGRLLGCVFVDHGKSNKQITTEELISYKSICKELKAAIESASRNSISCKKVA